MGSWQEDIHGRFGDALKRERGGDCSDASVVVPRAVHATTNVTPTPAVGHAPRCHVIGKDTGEPSQK